MPVPFTSRRLPESRSSVQTDHELPGNSLDSRQCLGPNPLPPRRRCRRPCSLHCYCNQPTLKRRVLPEQELTPPSQPTRPRPVRVPSGSLSSRLLVRWIAVSRTERGAAAMTSTGSFQSAAAGMAWEKAETTHMKKGDEWRGESPFGPCRASPALFLFRNHGFSLSGGLPPTGRDGERPQRMQAGSNSGRTAYRASAETRPDPFSEGEGSAGPILSESEGAGEV